MHLVGLQHRWHLTTSTALLTMALLTMALLTMAPLARWHSTDCWLKCAAADLITDEGRDIVIGIVDTVPSK